jgi:hypothetical protein
MNVEEQLVVMNRDENSPYHNLEGPKRQSRLLRLLDSAAGCIRCELNIVSLLEDDLPRCKALSYRWGEDTPYFIVYLDDHPIPVRQNLQTIMTQMVDERWRDWLFIDALCIDQGNELEKPGQVGLMGEIYRRAEEVVTWIVYEPDSYESEEDGPVDVCHIPRAQLESAVLQNSYWSRLWSVQEVLLARRSTIRIGSAEVEWSNLIPEKTPFDRRGLPRKNEGLSVRITNNVSNKDADRSQMRQVGTTPWANKNTALNILSYRRIETRSLRAGRHLPFHKAFDFFAMQQCGRPHDKIFGYLGLTNSRIQVDYSVPVLDLFVATLADYLLSAGFITEDLTPLRRRMQFYKSYLAIANANDLVVPLLAFDLELYDPVVSLLFYEVLNFFIPGRGEHCHMALMNTWWFLRHSRLHDLDPTEFFNLNEDGRFKIRQIGSVCVKSVKFIVSEGSACAAKTKEIAARQKALAQEDAVLTAIEGGESRKYSEWVIHAKAISEQMWRRFKSLAKMQKATWRMNRGR